MTQTKKSDSDNLTSNMKGYVDRADSQYVAGWVVDFSDVAKHLRVKVLIDNTEICSGLANLSRQDLTENLDLRNTDHAYSLKIPEILLDDREHEIKVIEAETGFVLTNSPVKVMLSKAGSQNRRSYQSWDDAQGDSNSIEKRKRLRLPSLEGLKVLDIGCNEGYFCNYAIRNGASRVVGIDTNPVVIQLAKQRTPEAEFLHTSWWNLPDEKFDIIFFFSAIHYEKNQKALLTHLRNYLTSDGLLILECGTVILEENPNFNHWYLVQRHDGSFRYPNKNYLIDTLLDGYAVTLMGRSVDQSGDPIPRFVFHCRPRKPTFLFLYGNSGSGKTFLARNLSNHTIPIYSFDSLFHRLIGGKNIPKNKVCEFIKNNGNVMKLDTLSQKLVGNDLYEELIKLVMEELPFEANISILEGEILIHENFREILTQRIEEKGGLVWNVTKS